METFIKELTHLSRVYSEYGWGNGYVIIPKGHPIHGKDYNDLDYEVHGGLTFSELASHKLCDRWGIDEKHIGSWVIGFDTAHCNDNLENCPKEYVQQQADNLMQQIIDEHGE